ncbi:MAG: hypothetical protein AB1631_12115 [Acidobacteriota bacterium]
MALNGNENGSYKYQRGDAAIIPALASGKTLDEAAAASGIGKRTICRRQNDPAFQREVQRVQVEIVDKAAALLSDGAADAAKKLKELLSAQSENVQLGAARALMDFNLRLREEAAANELRERIDALELLLKSVRQ